MSPETFDGTPYVDRENRFTFRRDLGRRLIGPIPQPLLEQAERELVTICARMDRTIGRVEADIGRDEYVTRLRRSLSLVRMILVGISILRDSPAGAA